MIRTRLRGRRFGVMSRQHPLVQRNSVLLKNAASLALGSGSAAVMGFAFWWLAARSFSPTDVGLQSALISTMALIGLFGEAGFGTMLVGEATRQGDYASGLIAAASVAALVAATVLAVPAAILSFLYAWTDLPTGVLFVLGCALTGFSLVIDQAFVGLLRGTYQLNRSVLFSTAKLVLLVGLAVFTKDQAAIMLAWVVGLALSLAGICSYAWTRKVLKIAAPNFRALAVQTSTVISHHLLNLAASAPSLILPLLVSAILSPAVNAAFYAGWMVLNIALMGPASLTTVLFTVGTIEPSVLPQRLRFSLALSAAFSVAGAIVLFLFPRLILGIFNPEYPTLAAPAVQLFGFGLLGGSVKFHYVLLARMRRRMMQATGWLALGGCSELVSAAFGGYLGDVGSLTAGWSLAVCLESSLLLRPVLHSAGMLGIKSTGT